MTISRLERGISALARVASLALALALVLPACSANDDPRGPADPSDPSDPKDPTDPVDPKDPTDPVTPVDPGQEVRSEKQRITDPTVAVDDVKTQLEGNSAFAFDLYQQVRGEPGNLFYSPHSITIALAMLHGGARHNTEAQIAQAMHYLLPQSQLHPFFNHLDLELGSRGQGSQAADGGKFRLNIVNAIWGQTGYPFLPSYLDLLALNYGAGLRVMDFAEEPETCRQTINDWVEQQTEQRIKDLLPQGSISSLTRLVLTNAIYFNAAWAKPFEESATKDGTFHLVDGTDTTVPMMHGVTPALHGTGTDLQAVALSYDGGELSMLIIVPDAGKFAAVEQQLSSQLVSQILGQLSGGEVELTLPKFEFEHSLGVKQHLQALGMVDAFSPGAADLSGIDDSRELFVSDVLHKAFVKVNEAGTEAAAATAVIVGTTSVPPPPVPLVVDRPFIFLIRDHATGAVLFVGRVMQP